ncbi:hypothetical protein TNIN_414361 [Trichonephila inaurata madagascariensis]|uniref:Uncharacterized protein n=1 Tax=Trichonephila inaurata madagascariensis TaxID=2747483 RepID=A0A8X6X4X3_9ARAC|nr:hypothetical protein TNIN_414361 [Trichonephila inaurata madagascariensis]
MIRRLVLRLSISQNNVFKPDHGHQECWTGFRYNQLRPSDPSLDPCFTWGTTQVEKYRFHPLLLVGCSLSTLELALWCFSLHNKASDGVEGCAWDDQTHSIPLRNKEECKPCQRRPLKLIAGGVY